MKNVICNFLARFFSFLIFHLFSTGSTHQNAAMFCYPFFLCSDGMKPTEIIEEWKCSILMHVSYISQCRNKLRDSEIALILWLTHHDTGLWSYRVKAIAATETILKKNPSVCYVSHGSAHYSIRVILQFSKLFCNWL